MTAESARWWRIEVTDAGKVLSCTPVERAEQNGRHWYYVQAVDQKAAGRAAFNLYCRDMQRNRRARLIKEGNCGWCGRANDREASKRCSRCVAKDREYGVRKTAKAAGKPVPVLDRKAAIAARKKEEQAEVVKSAAPSLRLDVLLEVQDAWLANPRVNGFTRWLTEQIAAARGKRVA